LNNKKINPIFALYSLIADSGSPKKQQTVFGGVGHVLGTGARPRPKSSASQVTHGLSAPKKPKLESGSTAAASTVVTPPTDNFDLVPCPVCAGQFFQMDINTHLDSCLSRD
jgi:hypothetical protein